MESLRSGFECPDEKPKSQRFVGLTSFPPRIRQASFPLGESKSGAYLNHRALPRLSVPEGLSLRIHCVSEEIYRKPIAPQTRPSEQPPVGADLSGETGWALHWPPSGQPAAGDRSRGLAVPLRGRAGGRTVPSARPGEPPGDVRQWASHSRAPARRGRSGGRG